MTRTGSLRAAGYRLPGRIAVLILVSLSPALLVTPSTVEARGFWAVPRKLPFSAPQGRASGTSGGFHLLSSLVHPGQERSRGVGVEHGLSACRSEPHAPAL